MDFRELERIVWERKEKERAKQRWEGHARFYEAKDG